MLVKYSKTIKINFEDFTNLGRSTLVRVVTCFREVVGKVLLNLLHFEIAHTIRQPHFLLEFMLCQLKQFSKFCTVRIRMRIKAKVVATLVSE